MKMWNNKTILKIFALPKPYDILYAAWLFGVLDSK